MFTLLHVDNSSFFRRIFKDYFEKKGYRCLSAETVDMAFALLQGNEIDLIVTGIEVRGGGGEFFTESVNKSEYRNVPIIVCTGTDSIDERKKMFSMGVIDYVPKTKDFAEHIYRDIQRLTRKDPAREKLKKMKIAVLDDSKMELGIIKNILQLNNITDIDFYTDPAQLLSSSRKYSIYFVDIVLPHISGEQVILNLRSRFPESVIIAVSGIDNYKVISNILNTGANDYMLKPFNASIFMARLSTNVRTYLLYRALEKKNRKLELISRVDDLTGVYNHSYIHEQLVAEIRASEKENRNLSIILFGIDSFSIINENYGHHVGDRIIRTVAETIGKSLSDIDILGRYGGVEFLLILPETSIDEARSLAETIRKKINKVSFKNHRLSISGGAVEHEKGESAMDMIRKADSLLFNARKKGKNRLEVNFDWENY